jgi:hypothetical protein
MDPRFNQSPATAHASLTARFNQATASYPSLVYETDFLMAGSVVRARIVGRALHDAFVKAFAHLTLAGDSTRPVALDVRLFDASEVGDEGATVSDEYNPSQPGAVVAAPDGRFVFFGRPQLDTVLDRVASTVTGVVGSAARLTLYDLGRPLHSELLLWHNDRGLLPVHAGLVSREGQGVLLAGPGGSGKSTTSVMCHLAGFAYLADDYVAVEWKADGSVQGHSIYNSTHIEPDHLKRFPAHVASASRDGQLTREDKSLIILSGLDSGAFANDAAIRVLALPRVAHTTTTTVRPASKVEALMRLAPSSLFLLPYAGMGRLGFERLKDLVHRVPAYWLELGENLEEIPGVVDALLQQELVA